MSRRGVTDQAIRNYRDYHPDLKPADQPAPTTARWRAAVAKMKKERK